MMMTRRRKTPMTSKQLSEEKSVKPVPTPRYAAATIPERNETVPNSVHPVFGGLQRKGKDACLEDEMHLSLF